MRRSLTEASLRIRPATSARLTNSVTVCCANCSRPVSSVTVDRSLLSGAPLISNSSKYRWGVNPWRKATFSLCRMKRRSPARNSATRMTSSSDGCVMRWHRTGLGRLQPGVAVVARMHLSHNQPAEAAVETEWRPRAELPGEVQAGVREGCARQHPTAAG